MDRKFLELFRQFMKEQKKRKIWKKAVSVLAGFVVFFTTYALILPAITMESTIVCGIENHEHTKDCYGTDLNAPASTLSGNTLSGNTISGNEVNEDSVVEEKSESVEAVPYIYEDDELAVTVTLPDGSSVPEGAVLRVRPIMDTDEEYEDLAQQAEEAVDGQAQEIVLYDISFYTEENEYIPVSEEAVVSFQFKETVLAETSGEVTVLHYEEGTETPTQLAEVEIKTDKNDAVEKVTFQTEGFSVFALVKILPEDQREYIESIDIEEGEYYILRNAANGQFYVMMAESSKTYDGYYDGMKNTIFANSNISRLADCTVWNFEKTDGGYCISARTGTDTVTTVYLKANKANNSTAELLLIEEKTDATVFTVSESADGDGVLISCILDGITYYINNYGGDNYATAFAGYYEGYGGSVLNLYRSEDPTTVNDLDGRSFVIVSNVTTRAITTESKTSAAGMDTGLNAKEVSVKEDNGKKYVISDDAIEWTFEKTSVEGVYNISTIVNGSKKYLRMLDTKYPNPFDGRGSFTLGDTAQNITVVTSDSNDGSIYLTTEVDGKNGYVNFDDYYQCFWTYNGTQNCELCLYEKATEVQLVYDLNIAGGYNVTYVNNSDYWGGTLPNIPNVMQMISAEGTNLYTVDGIKNDSGYFVYCSNLAEIAYSQIDDANRWLKSQGKSYGKEFSFEGWTATVNGVTYIFAEDALAVQEDDGIHIKDVNGTEVVVPEGTILEGKWRQISDLVTFYVNYAGTILDTEGDVSGRNQEKFTPMVGIARIYYGTVKVGTDDVFATEANSSIQAVFRNQFDPNDTSTQIVMEYVSIYDSQNGGYDFKSVASGINPSELETAVLKYIKDSDSIIQISTKNKDVNPAIDSNNADSDHYQVRWYVLKEQDDGWHIDGVLIAKTADIEVTKTFSGLEKTQTDDIMKNLNIDVKLGKEEQKYLNISDEDIEDQCVYHGQDATGLLSYSWTLHAILDEIYNMQENDYTLPGYDVSSVVVIRTKDGNYYSASETNTNAITDEDKYLIGGTAQSVSFNNFYTKTGTGMFNIVKRDKDIALNDASGKLPGAEFTLTNIADNTSEVKTTNINGSVTFNNLAVGTYTLEETKAPNGYVKSSKKWTVKVEKDSATGYITVTITDNETNASIVVYQTGTTNVIQVYEVDNTSDGGTVIITKQFENISSEELGSLKADYQITITSKNGSNTIGTLTLNAGSYESVSVDGFTYTWRLIGVDPGKYLVTESKFRNISSKDTVVGTNSPPVTIDYVKQIASFEFEIAEGSTNQISIVNKYTDEFILEVIKKSENNITLAGAEFDVYVESFHDATVTEQQITYMDGSVEKTGYYVGSIVVGDDGTGTVYYNGKEKLLKLSDATDSFTYILSETKAPDGYALLKEPIVIKNVGPRTAYTVKGGKASGVYNNGVFEVTVPNTPVEKAMVSVTASKKWEGLSDGTEETVELQLYRKTEKGSLDAVGPRVPMDGTVDSNGETESWKYTWSNLAAYDTDGEEYSYYVYEVPMDGFEASYSNGTEEHTYNGDKLSVGTTIWSLKELAYEVTITNATTYRLPETGGSGALWYTIGGICLMMAAAFLYKRDRMMKGGRGS